MAHAGKPERSRLDTWSGRKLRGPSEFSPSTGVAPSSNADRRISSNVARELGPTLDGQMKVTESSRVAPSQRSGHGRKQEQGQPPVADKPIGSAGRPRWEELREGYHVWLKPFTVADGADEEQPRQHGTIVAAPEANGMLVVQLDDCFLDLDSLYPDDGLRECSVDQLEGY
jgi:hypothetical protein